MITLRQLIQKLHKDDRESNFVNALFTAIYNKMAEVNNYVAGLKNEFFFDTLTLFSITAYERLMKITPFAGASVEDRRSAIRARWRANGKNTIALIQDVCNSWQNGEILARFLGGKIILKFVASLGIPSPSALLALTEQIEEIIPAHIGYEFIFKFLLKKEIHHILTKNQMQNIKKNVYCNVGVEQ